MVGEYYYPIVAANAFVAYAYAVVFQLHFTGQKYIKHILYIHSIHYYSLYKKSQTAGLRLFL